MLTAVSKYCHRYVTFCPCCSEFWVLIQFYHLLYNLVVATIQIHLIIVMLRLVTTLLYNPLLLTRQQISFKCLIVLTNNPFYWIKVAISNIVGAFGNASRTFDVIRN